MKIFITIISLFFVFNNYAQEKIETTVDKPATPIGGKSDIDFVIQSQLIYPEQLLKEKVSQDVAVYFTVTSKGYVQDIEFKQDYDARFKNEAIRLLRYFIFQPAKIGNVDVSSQTFLLIKFNPDAYKKAVKARGFAIAKDSDKMDTSFVVHQRADASPEYIKGNDALIEFIKENLEYPDLAIRQNIQGTVMLNFIVEPNGTISNLIAEKEFNHLCTNEAFRIIRQTKWKPATIDGKLVRYKVKYPIIFNLNNINKDNANGEQR